MSTINIKDTKSQANTIIQRYTLLSGGAGLVPYDFVDVAASTIAQTMMIRELCQLYNVRFSDKWVNMVLWSATGSAVIKALVEVVETILEKTNTKPVFDLTAAAVSAVYTGMVGQFYQIHLSRGGTLENISVAKFVEYVIKEIKTGEFSMDTFTNPKALMGHLKLV